MRVSNKLFKLALLVLMLVITSGQSSSAASGQRKFYVTKDIFTGSETVTACAKGYHMASFFEILDVSNLRYDTVLGFNKDDSGSGPPFFIPGWIRTGDMSSADDIPGQSNCFTWTSDSVLDFGTAVLLGPYPEDRPVSTWLQFTGTCDLEKRVWCIQN